MAHLLFHNNTVDLNHLLYESHRNLITSICMELGAVDKAEELTQKYLADMFKIKAQKDPNSPRELRAHGCSSATQTEARFALSFKRKRRRMKR